MQITAVILSGGKSTRMGTDKALIKIEGKTLLEIALDICRPVCNNILISSNNPEHDKNGYQIIPDKIPNCGPIGGIYSSLKLSETEWNFIISVDTPYVTSDFIQFLARQAENCDAVVPVHSGEREPLIAFYNKSAIPVIKKQIELQQFKIHQMISLLNTKFVDTGEWVEKAPLLFKNLNRPDDLPIKQ